MFEQDPPSSPTTTIGRVFFGADGLRAGWSLFVFLAPFLALYFLARHLTRGEPAPTSTVITPTIAIFSEGLQLALFIAAAFILSIIERRPFSRYGLPFRHMLPDLAAGILCGLTFLSLLIATLFLTHHIAFDGIALRNLPALAYATKWAAAFLLVGLFEEFAFRGYLLYTLARGIAGLTHAVAPRSPHAQLIGFLSAAFVFSIVAFSWTHISNGGETPEGIATVALVGAVFAFSLYRTGSLWWAIGFHSAWDWAQSYLYGTADSGGRVIGQLLTTHPVGSPLLSGGSVGPEGSLFVLPILLLVALIIHLTLPRRPYPFP